MLDFFKVGVEKFLDLCYGVTMRKNPIPLKTEGKIITERGVRPKPHEYITAKALSDAGYIVRFVPSSKVIGMADCYINNTLFEIKAPEGKTTACVERNIRKALDHQSPNIVLDSFRMKNIQDRSVQNFLLKRLKLKHGIQRIIFVNKRRKAIDLNSLLR